MSETQSKPLKVYLALPTYANAMRKDFVLSLLDLLAWNPIPGVEFTVGTVGGDGVARARNNLAQSFLLSTDCDVFLSLDVDIVFTRDHIAEILRWVSPERPVVGGLYACKQMAHRWIMTPLEGEEPDAETGLQKVMESGEGFKARHRVYFERVMEAFPEIMYLCDGAVKGAAKWDFFSMGVVNCRYLSEDYYADHRARKIGMDVLVQTRVQLEHEGFIRYPFKDNVEVFRGITVEKLHRMAEEMGNASPRDFDSAAVSRRCA